jgi:hypothetical protein
MTDDDGLKEAVKTLFAMIRAGRVVLTESVPATRDAIAAVQFTSDGEPVMETVTPLARAAARAAAAAEEQQDVEVPDEWRERFAGVERMLPDRVEVTDDVLDEATRLGDHYALAFNLYREMTVLVSVCAAAAVGTEGSPRVLDRNRAIIAGLLVRIAKFMRAILQLAFDRKSGEVTLALNRSILESATDIMYLCADDSPERFDRYVKDGLATERALYDRVQANVAKRGRKLPIEERLLAGVADIFRESGVSIEEVDSRRVGLDLASRLRAVGREEDYLFVQKIPAVTVHGTWLDLLHHHLREVEGGFAVRFEQTPADVAGLLPLGIMVLDALAAFVTRHLSHAPEAVVIEERVDDLRTRMRMVVESHELWFQAKRRQGAQPKDTNERPPVDDGGEEA